MIDKEGSEIEVTRQDRIYCLKASSDYHSEVCEECRFYPNCDHMAQDDMTELTIKDLETLEQKPCEDAVSREDAMSMILCYGNEIKAEVMDDIKASMIKLPPATPTQNWIPVNERLPKPFTYVNATCRSLVDDRENWVIETMYLPIPKENNEQGYSDWGNIPMLNWGKAEVIAWMERKIPEPYKEEKKCCSNCKHHTDGEEIHGVTPCGSCDIDKKNFEKDKRKEEHI